MTLLDRPRFRQLRLHVEPSSYHEALGSVVATMPVYPRAIASCGGTNRPEALMWSHRWVERCGSVLDIGAGLGGPATFMHQSRVGPTLLCEPDPTLAERAREFSGLAVVVAAAESLPFGDDTFGGATALAMISQVDDRPRSLAETARVVRSGGHVSMWAYVSASDETWATPNAEFSPLSQVESDLLLAGFEIVEWEAADTFGDDPAWDEIQQRARNQLASQYGHIPSVRAGMAEDERIAVALESGRLTSMLYRLRVR